MSKGKRRTTARQDRRATARRIARASRATTPPADASPQTFPSHGRTIMGCPSYRDGAPCSGTITDKVVEVREWAFGKLGKLEPCPYCGRQLSISLSLDVVA